MQVLSNKTGNDERNGRRKDGRKNRGKRMKRMRGKF
jgi:hypothetical protein